MKPAIAVFGSLAAAFASVQPQACLADAAQPAPSPVASGAPAYCNARIAYGAGLDAARGTHAARTWALALTSLDSRALSGSGTLALYVGTQHYEVPFADAALAADEQRAMSLATPIVVRFPQPVVIDGGYVSSTGGADPVPCVPAALWTNRPGQQSEPKFAKRASSVAVQDVPEPSQWKGACAAPIVPAQMSKGVQPATPEIARISGVEGNVSVTVTLANDGSVARAELFDSSGSASLDESALRAARESTYLPAKFDCKPIDTVGMFRAEFRSH